MSPPPPTVLVVDDEAGPRESLRAILRPQFRVLTADSGSAALTALEDEPVDVVTLDLRMPDLSGLKVLAEIKARNPDTEVLIITGYGSLDTAVAGLRLRAFDYLCKPFDVAHVRDVVARALARRDTMRRLQQVKENFLGNVSHEFRTPLNAILGYTSILLEEDSADLSAEQRRTLERVRANSYDLLTYVDTALYLSALESGEVPLVLSVVDAAQVAGQVVGTVGVRAEDKRLGVRLESHGGYFRIRTDAEKLRRLLLALVENSVKFTEQGEVVVRIQAAATDTGVRIEIRDTGVGMGTEEQRTVLEGLTQGDSSDRKRHRGLGLGLRLVRLLTHALGASVDLQSAPRQGTRFCLYVPSLPEPSDMADDDGLTTGESPSEPQ